jgi:hypothetical protein
MSDLNPTNRMALGDALRALPLATPARDSWAELAAQLAPVAPRRRRHGVPLAIAAACVLAVVAALAVRRMPPASVTAPSVAATVVAPAASSIPDSANDAGATNMKNTPGQQIDALAAAQIRSQSLERWLHDTRRAGSPLPAQDLAAATEMENMIGMVDVELAESAPPSALPLWQRRVALLEDLTALRYSNYRLAEIAAATPAAGTLNPVN